MFDQRDTARLAEEIDRYLAAVDLFRALGCEPVWRPESGSAPPVRGDAHTTDVARIAH